MFSFLTDTSHPPYFPARGIKCQQQHYEMMMMAEEIVRLVAEQSPPKLLTSEAVAFVKVSRDCALPMSNDFKPLPCYMMQADNILQDIL